MKVNKILKSLCMNLIRCHLKLIYATKRFLFVNTSFEYGIVLGKIS